MPIDEPYTQLLVNPHGVRHLAFDDQAGNWVQLWQHHPNQPISAGEALLLRPSDIDMIIRLSNIWIMRNPGQRAAELTDELASGAKALVLHYAKLAGAN